VDFRALFEHFNRHPVILYPLNCIMESTNMIRGLKNNKSAILATRKVSRVISLSLYVRPSTIEMQMANARLITIIMMTTLDMADFLEL
jgi:hypothetical protein